jgi:predicted MFS family arabinose efflux permease
LEVERKNLIKMEKTDEEAAVDGAKGTALKDEKPAHELSTPSNKPTTSATIPDVHEKAPEELRTKSQTALIMLALCMALFLAALDMTIIFTAAPTIVAHFQASGAGYLWIGAAYLLACAATVPSWGKISDIFGRKPVLLVANVIFFVGSLICGLAVSMKMLLVGRVLQGVGGGGLISLVSICIGDLFSERWVKDFVVRAVSEVFTNVVHQQE